VHTVIVRCDEGLESVAVSRTRRGKNVPVDIPGRVTMVVDAKKAIPPYPNGDLQPLWARSDGGGRRTVRRRQ
jgi:hypothetical protein